VEGALSVVACSRFSDVKLELVFWNDNRQTTFSTISEEKQCRATQWSRYKHQVKHKTTGYTSGWLLREPRSDPGKRQGSKVHFWWSWWQRENTSLFIALHL